MEPPLDTMITTSANESSSGRQSMNSDPELELMPSASRLLDELLILQRYQTDPGDPECQSRIDDLRVRVALQARDDREREEAEHQAVFDNITDPVAYGVRRDSLSHTSTIAAHDACSEFTPTPSIGWSSWLDQGIPEIAVCLELFRLVRIGCFPYPNYDGPRWLWYLLNREICMPTWSVELGLCNFRGLHGLLWRERRNGLCQRRELAIRRTRRDFGPPPHDFEAAFRDSHEAELGPDILILGRTGFNTSWDLLNTGVQNPTSDGVRNLNWDGNAGFDQNDVDLADILEGADGIPDLTTQMSASPAGQVFPPDVSGENVVAISDDDPSLVPYPKDFRRVGAHKFESPTSRCGGLNDVTKGRFHTVFDKAKLEALFSGLADSARVSYQSSWLAWGRFCFVRGISMWLTPGDPGWGEPLLDFLIWTSKVLGRRSPTLKTRSASIRFMRLIDGNVDFSLQSHRAKAMMNGA